RRLFPLIYSRVSSYLLNTTTNRIRQQSTYHRSFQAIDVDFTISSWHAVAASSGMTRMTTT
uniref:Uncharacterized protein n=1 Tax=Aegilops tauschii subsp. strangulata TaxID=200361 RepID=A0A453Q661_AEGTS